MLANANQMIIVMIIPAIMPGHHQTTLDYRRLRDKPPGKSKQPPPNYRSIARLDKLPLDIHRYEVNLKTEEKKTYRKTEERNFLTL